ncbi:hypothetical protein ACFY1B_49405 [Streptomyces mirabilis]|uniref:hypothetical protein n=1 Tax=Streptomyces mirabilis TaxID=68239 RepID=UPI0036C245A3
MLSDGRDEPEEDGLRAVRAGLLSLLGTSLATDPADLALDDGRCPHCGGLHALSAVSPAGRRVYFATVRHAGLVVHAVCPFPVGLGLAAFEEDGTTALARARKAARLAAHRGAVARGRCVRPRDGSVQYVVRYVETAPDFGCVVSVVWEVPYDAEPGTP